MENIKKSAMVAVLIITAIFTIGAVAQAGLIKNEQNIAQNNTGQLSMFEAEITFYVLTGEGCGCDPITGASIIAFGGEGQASGVTDDNGLCKLTLEILGEYEVEITTEDYVDINFEFNVLDDQTFTFHMFEKEESATKQVYSLNTLLSLIINR